MLDIPPDFGLLPIPALPRSDHRQFVPSPLSSRDLDRITEAIEILLSPLSFASMDEWRSKVNRLLSETLGADSAGFFLPGSGHPYVFSDEHDPVALSRYPEILPPLLPDGGLIFDKAIELGVSTLDDLWEDLLPAYLKSAYHVEYAGANQAFDALSGVFAVEETHPMAMAGLQFWHSSPRGRQFGAREKAIFGLIFPALKAGVQAQLRWGRHRVDFLESLDGLDQAALVYDADGRRIHETPAAARLLAADPERDSIEVVIDACATATAVASDRVLIARAGSELRPLIAITSMARYQATGSTFVAPLPGDPKLVVVAIERTSPVLRSASELSDAYGLTAGEFRVAAFLVSSLSSGQIARELNLSVHTVRSHSERILAKTRARSRAELALRILK